MNQLLVFWPTDCHPREGDFVLGWRLEHVVVVIGTKAFPDENDARVTLDSLRERLEEDDDLPEPLHPLAVLGSFKGLESNAPAVDWLPEIASSKILNIVYFKRPSSTHYRLYSIEGIDLDLLLSIPNNWIANGDAVKTPTSTSTSTNSRLNIEKMYSKQRDVRKSALSPLTISLLNKSKDTMDELDHLLNRSPRSSEKAGVVRGQFWKMAAEDIPGILVPLISRLRNSSRLPFSKVMAASSRQIDLRLEQIGFVLESMPVIKQRPELVFPTQRALHHASYISSQNALWLILNDTILGISAGMFLLDNKLILGDIIFNAVNDYTIKDIRNILFWLDHWPAGLKLNTELSAFSYATLSAMLDVWEDLLYLARPLLPFIVMMIGVLGFTGLSMILASLSDLLSCLTIHLDIVYVTIRIAFRNQLVLAQSLFNLFRGKRYNVLRSRLDDWNFDLDQLLLGAMLFTLISFLFPTILVYYILFASARFATLMLRAAFQVALALVNHFPLFALTLRLKDPSRLPGGIVLIPYSDESEHGQATLILQSTPKRFTHIFSQYFVLGSRLASHYSPGRLIPRVFRGQPLDPIPSQSIRYTYGRKNLTK